MVWGRFVQPGLDGPARPAVRIRRSAGQRKSTHANKWLIPGVRGHSLTPGCKLHCVGPGAYDRNDSRAIIRDDFPCARRSADRIRTGDRRRLFMMHLGFGMILLLSQLLSLGGGGMPQVMEAKYSDDAVEAGAVSEVIVSFDVLDGYAINRVPPIQLKLQPVGGLTHDAANRESPPEDPKSTDDYYVDVPAFNVAVKAAVAGDYEIPGELVYFFCSKADGFCSRQIVDVVVPVTAE